MYYIPSEAADVGLDVDSEAIIRCPADKRTSWIDAAE